MRKLAFATVFAVLLPLGARSEPMQQYGPTERIPNSDAMNFHPRWLGALSPDPAMDLSGQPTTATMACRARSRAIRGSFAMSRAGVNASMLKVTMQRRRAQQCTR